MKVATFELTLYNLFFFQIDYFYFINRLLKKHSKTGVCYRRCLNKGKIYFLLISNRKKRSWPPFKIYWICFYTISTSKSKKVGKNEILAHRKKYFFYEMNGINFKRWSRRLSNLASFGEINNFYFLIKESFDLFLLTRSFVVKIMI
jgi:hypothetical protein